jgi:hypothetical protein
MQIERLHYHLGLLNAQQLLCDVFNQNKGAYILKLNNDALSIPSMVKDLNEKHKYDFGALSFELLHYHMHTSKLY